MFVGIGFASSDQDEMVVHLLGLGLGLHVLIRIR